MRHDRMIGIERTFGYQLCFTQTTVKFAALPFPNEASIGHLLSQLYLSTRHGENCRFKP
jgi:hypothetical protein